MIWTELTFKGVKSYRKYPNYVVLKCKYQGLNMTSSLVLLNKQKADRILVHSHHKVLYLCTQYLEALCCCKYLVNVDQNCKY